VKTSAPGLYRVQWGDSSQVFSSAQLAEGINLAAAFRENPFSDAFDGVMEAVGKKQAYETEQVKRAFHSAEAKNDFAAVVQETEAIRQPLADAVAASVRPVTHTLAVQRVADEPQVDPVAE
jgi:hypothetical protein